MSTTHEKNWQESKTAARYCGPNHPLRQEEEEQAKKRKGQGSATALFSFPLIYKYIFIETTPTRRKWKQKLRHGKKKTAGIREAFHVENKAQRALSGDPRAASKQE